MERALLCVVIFLFVFMFITAVGYMKAYRDGELNIQIRRGEAEAMKQPRTRTSRERSTSSGRASSSTKRSSSRASSP